MSAIGGITGVIGSIGGITASMIRFTFFLILFNIHLRRHLINCEVHALALLVAPAIVDGRAHWAATLGSMVQAVLVREDIDNKAIVPALHFTVDLLAVGQHLTTREFLLLFLCQLRLLCQFVIALFALSIVEYGDV